MSHDNSRWHEPPRAARTDALERTLAHDAHALARSTERGLPPLSALSRALQTSNQGKRANIMTNESKRKRWIGMAAIAAVLLAAGAVFATTQTGIISFWVETDGKSDDQIEDEIREQLIEGGMTDPEVEVERDSNGTKVEIEGAQGDRQIKLIRKQKGGAPGVIQMHHEPLDTTREPGMTDEQLAAKIRAQLQARGMDGEVEVNGDDIRVRVEKRVEATDDSGD